MSVGRCLVNLFRRQLRIICVFKFERYFQLGRMSIASWLGPTAIGKDVLILFFKRTVDGIPRVEIWAEIRTAISCEGSLMAPTALIIVKRAILTGHPYRVHKKVVTMRYMFFNREDVLFFKPVQLVSKQGRRGGSRNLWKFTVSTSLSKILTATGYFKVTFDGKIDKQDTVGMSLFKRIWPKLGV
jgi:pre-rRNA-processing protein TSR1